MRKISFQPVADSQSRILIVGSLPGEQSLAKAEYYGNPLNQFWRLMSGVIERPLVPLPYLQRLEALRAAKVGLWDVVASARRAGSLDAAIRDPETNDLAGLAAALPALRAVGFNGGTAFAAGRRLLAGSALVLLPLPSSSPAYTLSFESKLEKWMELRAFL
ncbi:DNA-deoxyinosine glycosylase [Allosphingosinicella flava]|uniref:DNA-deoxyinosine glycosylase n=1 Tax=Allosphingosinicella flava TaxID=2771430 RepID=A0A7T2GJB1_9SPHN|nr:DNA-deoxyinosine glycosylase [Sphingosinicella flava]QPQ54928.1 DNA-deoxyinosine glycosylase [Sphingosinicella flava]